MESVLPYSKGEWHTLPEVAGRMPFDGAPGDCTPWRSWRIRGQAMIAITRSVMSCDAVKMSCSTQQEWEPTWGAIIVNDEVCRAWFVRHIGEMAVEIQASWLTRLYYVGG